MIKDIFIKKLMYIFVLKDLIELLHNYPYSQKTLKLQNKRLRKIMKHCYRIPFYRQKFESVGLTPEDIKTEKDLYKFPLTTKQELRDWINGEVRKNPDKYKEWWKDSTSGSTGMPLNMYYSPRDRATNMAIWIHASVVNGGNPFFDVTGCVANPATVNNKQGLLQKIGLLRRYMVSYSDPVENMIEMINKYKPDFFYANRSQFVQMAMYAEKNNIKIHKPKICASAAEKMDKQSRRIINEYFGNGLYDTYGCTESGMLAFQLKEKENEYQIHHDTHIVHVLDLENKPAKKGRAILTSLYHYGFPIINYDVGDGLDTFIDEKSGLMKIREINGRISDWITLCDDSKITWQEIETIMKTKDFLQQFRFVQESKMELKLLLVPRADYQIDKKEAELILKDELEKLTKQKVKLIFEWKDELKPDANGKLRSIVSKL